MSICRGVGLVILTSVIMVSRPVEAEEITVGVSEFPPLVINTENGFTGLEIQVWEEVARRLGLKTVYVERRFPELLRDLQAGRWGLRGK